VVVPPGREDDGRRRRPAGRIRNPRPRRSGLWLELGARYSSRGVARSDQERSGSMGCGVLPLHPNPSDVKPVGARTHSPWVRLPSLVALGFIRAAA